MGDVIILQILEWTSPMNDGFLCDSTQILEISRKIPVEL